MRRPLDKAVFIRISDDMQRVANEQRDKILRDTPWANISMSEVLRNAIARGLGMGKEEDDE